MCMLKPQTAFPFPSKAPAARCLDQLASRQQLMAAMVATERSKVQRLYDACGIIFSSSPTKGLPTLRQLRWLQTILGIYIIYVCMIYIYIYIYACFMQIVKFQFPLFTADAMEPTDVGIDGSGDERSQESSHRLILGHAVREITYVHIHECQDFSVRSH